MAKTLVAVRIDPDVLKRLESLGQQITPKPLNRSEMVQVAVRDYVDRHDKPKPAKPEKK